MMQNTVEIQINSSPEAVWTVLFEQFGDLGQWYSGIKSSRWIRQPFSNDVKFGGRICETDEMGDLTEAFTQVSLADKTFTYQASPQKAPFFLKKIMNHWQVIDQGNGKTVVKSTVDVTIMSPFHFLLGGVLKNKFNKAISGLLHELKAKVETKVKD